MADNVPSLVSSAWLAQHADDRDLRVFDCSVLLGPDPRGHGTVVLRSPDELRAAFALGGVADDPGRVIAYCGGGIAASLDAFALALLGHKDVAVYDGSLMEWSADPSLPIETG